MNPLASCSICLSAFVILAAPAAVELSADQEPSSTAQETPQKESEGGGAAIDRADHDADFFDGADGDQHRVREVQRVLQEKGYYTGQIDGIAGPKTRSSVRDFQHDYELPVTGKVDATTAERLGIK